MSFFTVEAHVCYVRELKPDAMVAVSSRVLDFDAKRIHLFQELKHVEGWLSATSETVLLHVEMSGPKAAPMPGDVLAKSRPCTRLTRACPGPSAPDGRSDRARPGDRSNLIHA